MIKQILPTKVNFEVVLIECIFHLFPCAFTENVALRCPATASAYDHVSPSRAVDGITETDHFISLCFHTNSIESDPWWGVDLEVTRMVYSVDVTNRADCCCKINKWTCVYVHFYILLLY